jgi:uncharacterized small protein (TIGR04563 family)
MSASTSEEWMASTDKQKQSLYFPDDMLREIMREANRLDRSLSWTVQQAWRLAREEVRRFPSVGPVGETPRLPRPEPASRPAVASEPRKPSAQVLEFLKNKFDRDLAS